MAALQDEPNNAHAIALKARLDAYLHHLSSDQAKEVIQNLTVEHPGDAYLEVSLAAQVAQAGNRPAAIQQLRDTAERHHDDPYVHQALAGFLGCDRATWDEAWDHYKIALRSGPLMTPGYKSAAYFLAKRKEPSMARVALEGSTPLEAAALRTRAMGFNLMFFTLLFLVLVALTFDGLGYVAWGIGLMVVPSVAAAWFAFANYAVSCWRCAVAWLGSLLAMGFATDWAVSLQTRSSMWLVIAGGALALAYQAFKGLEARSRKTS